MNGNRLKQGTATLLVCAFCLATSCQSIDAPAPVSMIMIGTYGANAVSVWNDVAAKAINAAPDGNGTGEERQPLYAIDLATVHVAIYDAVVAIARTHKPYAITPRADTRGASSDAAASAAAYGVLKGLFPSRSQIYQVTYDKLLADIPEGAAKIRGIAVGKEVAQGVLALRANDGRNTSLATYVAGTAPGQFRGSNPLFRSYIHIRPFAISSAAQFRAAGPPAIGSDTYARDFNETKSFGAADSSTRTAQQTEAARFYTDPPPQFWPRNLQQFARSNPTLVENARLMAFLWVTHADAMIACFESKYYFNFWRPASAITLADSGPNAAVVADTAWKPVVPTPNHPEYPAAHSCGAGATAEAIRVFYGTSNVSFKFDSAVKDTAVHTFSTTDEFVNEMQLARIHGGMHFRTATTDGALLGSNVARWVAAHHFQKRH